MKPHTGDPKFDRRTLERLLREGSLTHAEVEKYLEKLPDEKANAEEVVISNEPASGRGPTFLA